MIKQLIVAVITLLIHNAPEAIQFACAILDFTKLAQYVLNDNKTLRCVEHVLYRLKKTKIAFEQHWPINSKLCQPTFNYPKFYIISHFVQYIWDYSNAVNNDIAYSKAML